MFALALKKLLIILLLPALFTQNFLSVGLMVYYNFNKEYYAQQLCVNKDKPQLHCNGHCELSKQLKKAEEGEKHQSTVFQKEKEEVVNTGPEKLVVALIASMQTVSLFPEFEQQIPAPPVYEIVHPPA